VPTKRSTPLQCRVGARLRQIRRRRGITQEDLALAANMDRSFVSGLERGEFNISLMALEKLARVLRVRIRDFIEDD
jgi:transcriptional regulator with XRE-family HTH domain